MPTGSLGELNIQIAANVAQLTQDVTKVEREMRKMRRSGVQASKQMDSAAKAITGFKKLAIGIGAVTVAWRALSGAVGSSFRAFEAQEDAETKLAAALGETNEALLDQAAALQKVTRFGDETIIEAQALIAAFVKDEEQIKAATKATLDLAAAKGMDLKAAADLVSKSLGSSTNALSRYGIEVKGAVGSTARLDSLVENVANRFGGQAAAQAETMAGRIQQMKNAFGDLQETIVRLAAPAITSAAEELRDLAVSVERVVDAFDKFDFSEAAGAPIEDNFITPLADGLTWLETKLSKVSELLDKIPGRKALAEKIQTGQRAIGAQSPEAEEEQERREAALQAATEQGERRVAIETNKTDKILEERRRLQNELAALTQQDLEIEEAFMKNLDSIHQDQQKRKKAEFDMDKALLDQKMNMTTEIVRSARAAETAGLASFNTTKKIGAAIALVNAYIAISQAWSDTSSKNIYQKIALVAYTAGQVFGVVSALRGVSAGGGGGGAASPGAPPAAGGQSLLDQNAQNVNVAGGNQTTIVFQGGTFIGGDEDTLARDMVPAINRALSDGQT